MRPYRASKLDCDVCPLQMRCCRKDTSRQVLRNVYEEARDVAGAIARTEAFEQTCRERKRIEMLFNIITRDRTGWPELLKQRTGKRGDQFDQLGLTIDAVLFIGSMQAVLTVVSAMPRASATSGTPPTSTTASNTRNSVGVSL